MEIGEQLFTVSKAITISPKDNLIKENLISSYIDKIYTNELNHLIMIINDINYDILNKKHHQ